MAAGARFAGVVMGLVLILLTGLVWGGIGLVLGMVARRRLNVLAFMAVATSMSSLASWACIARWPQLLAGDVSRPGPLVLLLVVAGIAGAVGMLYLQRSMTAGTAAWTVGQSAMVIPFVAGIVCFGEPLRVGGGLGVIAIVLSLAVFSRDKSEPNSDRSTDGVSWLRYALTAFVLLGIQQTLSSIPSTWDGWADSAGLRVPLVLTTGAIPLCIVALHRRIVPERAAWAAAVMYAALVVCGQHLLFISLDQLRAENRLSLAFPLALGTCIVVVALGDIFLWKRRLRPLALAGIGLGVLGVVLLAV